MLRAVSICVGRDTLHMIPIKSCKKLTTLHELFFLFNHNYPQFQIFPCTSLFSTSIHRGMHKYCYDIENKKGAIY